MKRKPTVLAEKATIEKTKKSPIIFKPADAAITIKAPNFARATVTIIGTAPYLQNRFSSENRAKMEETQKAGSAAKKVKRAKPPKDFVKVYKGSLHISQEGWHGIPATALRNAMIEACRLTEMEMTRARMCIFVIEDGLDRDDLSPLVKIIGKPEMHIERVRIGINSTDLAARGIFKKWSAKVMLEWDNDIFKADDVYNLLERAGRQVGIGAGRPLSKTSGGTGKGTFRVEM